MMHLYSLLSTLTIIKSSCFVMRVVDTPFDDALAEALAALAEEELEAEVAAGLGALVAGVLAPLAAGEALLLSFSA